MHKTITSPNMISVGNKFRNEYVSRQIKMELNR